MAPVPLSPALTTTGTYPFVKLEEAKRRLASQGVELIDFGKGDPREPTDPMIRQAVADSLTEISTYPLAEGLPELREAVAGWCARRFGVELDPDTEIVPTYGSKEAIFLLAQILIDRDGGRRLVVTTEPGYPVPDRGAVFAGAEVLQLPLLEQNGFLPDLDAVEPATWERAAIVWINYPNNPTGAVAPLDFLERLAGLSAEHGFLLASDEAYTELWFNEPPHSALEARGRGNVAVFNTLSKRSSMTGYRSGFVAADPDLIAALKQFRPSVGTAPQEFVQRASVVAWNDEEHVERTRAAYRRKRDALLPTLARKGIRVAGSEATMFLWLEAPAGESSETFATRLLEHGLVVSPGNVLRAGRRGLLAACARSDGGRVPPRRRDPGAGPVNAERVEEVIAALDRGELRVAEPDGGDWRVNPEAQEAILEYFRLRELTPQEVGPFEYHDKIPLKHDYAKLGVRVVPPAVARYGAFLSPGVVMMPSYVNIGAWVGPRTMVDTWATVGSGAQIGADVHLAGGVGIGGVLEPLGARPVIVEDGAFIGSRAILTEGVRVGAGAVVGPNVSLTSSVPIIDVTGDDPVEHRGFVPPRAIVVPGTRPKAFPAGTYHLACALIVGWRSEATDLKVSLNEALREHGLGS